MNVIDLFTLDPLAAHAAISELGDVLSGLQRYLLHQIVGNYAVDRKSYTLGWGLPEKCIKQVHKIETVVLVYGYFNYEDILTQEVLIQGPVSQIYDPDTESVLWAEKDGMKKLFYSRSSYGGVYTIFAPVIAKKGSWLVLGKPENSADWQETADLPPLMRYSSDEEASAPVFADAVADFGEIDFAAFPPQHYTRPWWDPRFGEAEVSAEVQCLYVRLPASQSTEEFLSRVKETAKIMGVLHTPPYSDWLTLYLQRVDGKDFKLEEFIPANEPSTKAKPRVSAVVADHTEWSDDDDEDLIGAKVLKKLRKEPPPEGGD